jgi:predicted nucleotidyltransferase
VWLNKNLNRIILLVNSLLDNLIKNHYIQAMKSYLKIYEQKAVNQFIARIKTELGNNLIAVNLFGSKVRGDFDRYSDIDILIIVKKYNAPLVNKIVDAQVDCLLKYDANLSPVIFSEAEYKKNIVMGSPFFENIERKGIPL